MYIKATIEGKRVRRILVDGGAAINFLLLRILNKLGKSKEKLKDINMIVIDYRGKATPSILLNVKVGAVEKPTLFVVIPSSYNLLL